MRSRGTKIVDYARYGYPVVRYHGAGVTDPNEPGYGGARPRGGKLKTGGGGVDTALAQVQTILRTGEEHHL